MNSIAKSIAKPLATDTAELLALVADEYLQAAERGEAPSVEKYAERYPEIATVLRDVLPALTLLNPSGSNGEQRNSPAAENMSDRTLGDFRLIREIGRGGMGVVYEAEQISLSRTVALKVLPFAGVLDARQLTRFRNESRAAAALHHNNIVPVYSVGCERGVHYYAMQYIEGSSLARVISALQRAEGKEETNGEWGVGNGEYSGRHPHPNPLPKGEGTISPSPSTGEGRGEGDASPSDSSLTTDWNAPQSNSPLHPLTSSPVHASADTAHAFLSTVRSGSNKNYFRNIAELGIQAAEALDHAHEMGVIHRDIKPANLLLDESGRLWIADFGLARLEADAGMTMTGDLIGTLRYMSPEQALAKRVVVDHRTDVYSLGVTLYELLALRPAFEGEDRQQLLKQIAFEDPPPLRKVNKQIPAELETIVEKAIRKNPAERYATAKDLADDLRRFLGNKAIKAKPLTRRQQFVKWAQRHPAGVRATGIALLVTIIVVAASIGWVARDQAVQRAMVRQQITQALEETSASFKSGNLTEAMSSVKRAEGLLARSSGNAELQQEATRWRTDLEMVKQLEQLRSEIAINVNGVASQYAYGTPAYEKLFREYGIDVATLSTEESARRIRNSFIWQELTAALDGWSNTYRQEGKKASTRLSQIKTLQIAKLADPDPFRNRVRELIESKDEVALCRLASEDDIGKQPTETSLMVAQALAAQQQYQSAIDVLKLAQRKHPADFWINNELAWKLKHLQPTKGEECICYARIAVALRPDSPGAVNHLGSLLSESGYDAESEATFRESIRLKPDYFSPHINLGHLLQKQGRRAEAEAAFQQVERIEPRDAKDHYLRGFALESQSKHAEAELAYRESLRVRPEHANTHSQLGISLASQAKFSEAEAEFREAIRIDSKNDRFHYNLGFLFDRQEKNAEAEIAYREAISLQPEEPTTYLRLSAVLERQGEYADAEAAARKCLSLKPDFAEGLVHLGVALERQGKHAEAEFEFREVIRIDPKNASAHLELGEFLARQRKLTEAEAEAREAVRLEPELARAHHALGLYLGLQHKDAEAEPEFREALRFEPDVFISRFLLGCSLSAQHKNVEAEAELREANRLNSDDARAHYGLGVVLAAQNKHAEAIDEWREAVRLKPQNAQALNGLAWLLATCSDEKVRDPSQGLQFAQKAIEIAPQDSSAWNNLGVAQYYSKEYGAAIESLEKAEKLKPDKNFGYNATILAMAHWHLGHKEGARKWLDQANEWIERNKSEDADLARFRAEALALIEPLVLETAK